ncbi:MAG: Xaa-Pro peptidase family protein [Actinomycetota bacterium]|nr:Xaa-Pro peptidase family protein [Actinomycetota bacterium]
MSDDDRFARRMARAADEAGSAGLSGMLVTPSADLVYLAGYDPPPLERLTCLFLRPGAEPVLVVPELEKPRAQASPAGSRVELVGWRDGQDPYEVVRGVVGPAGGIAVTDRTLAVHVLGLQAALPGARLVPASQAVPGLRAVKDPEEIELLARAAAGADEAFGMIARTPFAGHTESAVAASLGGLLLERGHDSVAFTIVASGPNGASPHHEPGERTIRPGDPVVLDFGGRVGGYCSDISRTVCVGEPPAEFLDVYEVVREAQERALQAVRPGVAAEDVDRAAREVIETAGFWDRFVHRTGHGIGLEEHEPPYIVAGNREPLRLGMCFSIEPGLYLEGRFGVRIEDIVVVTEEGATRLNEAPRDLHTVA